MEKKSAEKRNSTRATDWRPERVRHKALCWPVPEHRDRVPTHERKHDKNDSNDHAGGNAGWLRGDGKQSCPSHDGLGTAIGTIPNNVTTSRPALCK